MKVSSMRRSVVGSLTSNCRRVVATVRTKLMRAGAVSCPNGVRDGIMREDKLGSFRKPRKSNIVGMFESSVNNNDSRCGSNTTGRCGNAAMMVCNLQTSIEVQLANRGRIPDIWNIPKIERCVNWPHGSVGILVGLGMGGFTRMRTERRTGAESRSPS